jgi:hypothetical protein
MKNLVKQFKTQIFANQAWFDDSMQVSFFITHILLQQLAVASRINTWKPVTCFHKNGNGNNELESSSNSFYKLQVDSVIMRKTILKKKAFLKFNKTSNTRNPRINLIFTIMALNVHKYSAASIVFFRVNSRKFTRKKKEISNIVIELWFFCHKTTEFRYSVQ